MIYFKLKRFLDIAISLIGLIVLLPLLVIIAIAVKIDSKGPILFRQRRVGKDRSIFCILKFRTMRTDTPGDMPSHKLKDPERYITKTGWLLRKTSLDELPQILNILIGHMSIIGPRPALWNQYDLLEERDKYGANDIRPGLTGLAQINGRDELPVRQKAKLDGEYIRDMSFRMDVMCFFKTIAKVVKGDGVIEGSTGSMNEVKSDKPKETAV